MSGVQCFCGAVLVEDVVVLGRCGTEVALRRWIAEMMRFVHGNFLLFLLVLLFIIFVFILFIFFFFICCADVHVLHCSTVGVDQLLSKIWRFFVT